MQNVNNMGSLLQAYALKGILEEMGHDISFLEIKRIDEDYILLGDQRLKYIKESERGGAKGKLSKIDIHVINRLRNKKQYQKQNEIFALFREKELDIEKKRTAFDVCVIGSDEVFNCMNSGSWGFTSQLFGNIPEANRVITYAASCGATSYYMLTTPIREKIRSAIENLSAISVRDENTKQFVNNFTDKNILVNLDPVLIYDFQREISEAQTLRLPTKYCVVYSYINRIHDKKEIDAIHTFCKLRKLVPVAVGTPQFWCEKYIPCSPFECLKVFQKADCVITDTFHGTIMSVITRRPFVTVIRESNRNKLCDLLNRLGLKDRVCYKIDELRKIMSESIDYKLVDKIREEESVRSRTYLKAAIALK